MMATSATALLLRRQLALGFIERLAFAPRVAAGADHIGEHVMRQLHPLHAEAVLDPQQPPRHEGVHQRAGDAGSLQHGFEGDIVAEAGLGEQVVLDIFAHRERQIGDTPLIEIVENLAPVARHEISRDLLLTQGTPPLVELAADDTEERRLNLHLRQSFG